MRYHHEFVCGSDGKDHHADLLECVQKPKYGKRVNLQLGHEWRCFMCEQHGLQISLLFIISLISN